MAFFRRQRAQPAVASSAGPSTVVSLLAWTLDDPGRTARFIAILCSILFVLVVGITVGISFVIVATEGIRGVKPRYLLPTGVLGGGSVLTLITIVVRGVIRKKKQR